MSLLLLLLLLWVLRRLMVSLIGGGREWRFILPPAAVVVLHAPGRRVGLWRLVLRAFRCWWGQEGQFVTRFGYATVALGSTRVRSALWDVFVIELSRGDDKTTPRNRRRVVQRGRIQMETGCQPSLLRVLKQPSC